MEIIDGSTMTFWDACSPILVGARSVVETLFGRVCTSPNTNRVITPNEWEPKPHSLASLLFLPKMKAQHLFPPARPLCASQFALANYACSMLPFTPTPPPTPPSPPPSVPDDDEGQEEDHGQDHGHGHGHGHNHGHRHVHHRHRHHDHQAIPAEDNCCKWLNQLDNECVCELLVHLPNFLIRPAHAYSVAVGETCTVSYTCGTPIRIKI
ncbi:hypothetical protein COP1_031269 [Malus domestica]